MTGMFTRGSITYAASMVQTGGNHELSFKNAVESATDKMSIFSDALSGGLHGGYKGVKRPANVHGEKISEEEKRIKAVKDDFKYGSGKEINEKEADFIQKSLKDYTGSEHTSDIRAAYNDSESPYRGQMESLDDYVHNAPKYEGTVGRGINVTKDVADNLITTEKPLEMYGPSSWSSDEYVAQNFARDCTNAAYPNEERTNVVFVLDENKSGASVTHLSEYGLKESEVLAPSDARYIRDSYEYVKINHIDYLYIYVHER